MRGEEPVVLAEMTLRSLVPGPVVEHADFLARADILSGLGLNVLISRFEPFYELAEYLAAYTDRLIGIAVGVPTLQQVVDQQYYANLAGGVLEAVGRLFKPSVKVYVYPTRDPPSGRVRTLHDIVVPAPWQHLHDLLRELGRVEVIRTYDESYLSIHTPDVLARIERGDASWEEMVPPLVAEIIRSKRLFLPAPARPGTEALIQGSAGQ